MPKNYSQDVRNFSPYCYLKAFGFLLLAIQFSVADYPFVKTVRYSSSYLSADGMADYNIYLPPDYEESNLRYPVIFYTHGITDDMYTDTCQAGVLERLILAQEVNPMIVVYLNITSGGWYMDNGPGDMEESFIIKDMIPHIDSAYRTIGTPEGRAMDGFSMGGAGALFIAFGNAELFTAVLDWDGALVGNISGQVVSRLEDNVSEIKDRMSIKIVTGSLAYTHENLVSTLDRLDVEYQYKEVNVGHVATLGERGDADNRQCYDEAPSTEGWKFFSEVLAEPEEEQVSVKQNSAGPTVHFDKAQLVGSKIYTPTGQFLRTINSLEQAPKGGVYIIKSEKNPQPRIVYLD